VYEGQIYGHDDEEDDDDDEDDYDAIYRKCIFFYEIN